MDPNACYRDLTEAFEAKDYPTVEERTYSLLGWLTCGGFPPSGLTWVGTHKVLTDTRRAMRQDGYRVGPERS